MRGAAGAIVLVLLAESMPAMAQNFAPDEGVFRLEWSASAGAKGPALSGYVYNTTNRRAVLETPVPAAASYRVAVLSFTWVEDGGGGFLRRW